MLYVSGGDFRIYGRICGGEVWLQASGIPWRAYRLLEDDDTPEYGKPFFLAYVAQNIPLVITLVDWEEAVSCYPADMLGGKNDREDGHNENTCAVFVYPTPESAEEGQYSSLDIYDEMLQDNPIYMISTSAQKPQTFLKVSFLP